MLPRSWRSRPRGGPSISAPRGRSRSGARPVASAEGTIDSDAQGPLAVRDRAPVYVSDLKASDAGTGSVAALPLLTEVGALGYLGVWWAGPREAPAAEREYL